MHIREWAAFLMLVMTWMPSLGQDRSARQYAEKVAGMPLKISIRPSTRTPTVNQRVDLIVALLDGNDKPAKAASDVQITITVADPSGKTTTLTVTIKSGMAIETQSITPRSPGRYILEVTDQAKKLLSDKYSFYARQMPVKAKASLVPSGRSFAWFAAKPAPFAAAPAASTAVQPRLILELLARTEGVLSDGKDSATVSATYLGEDGLGAPQDIQVWFRRSHGDLDRRPLVIAKGGMEGRVLWTSKWPVEDASIDFVSATPRCNVDEPRSFKASFVNRVDGIVATGPHVFSLAEKPTITVNFLDHDGNTMKADRPRTVTFSLKDTGITVSPTETHLAVGGGPVTATLSPVSLGHSTIQIDSDGMRNGSTVFEVTVTIGSLILLALSLGFLGGALSYIRTRKDPLLRLMGGLAGGFVLAALWVFLGLVPIVRAVVPLNFISVALFSLIGGYVGTPVLDWAWGQMKKDIVPAGGG